jgi:cob(I)alamin adenosyltransferase
MTKIYTKGGDKGQTGLFDGTRVSKNHPLVNAYGTVDELNSVLGIARSWHALLPGLQAKTQESFNAAWFGGIIGSLISDTWPPKGWHRLNEMLHTIQVELFQLGADLASGHPEAPKYINDGQVERFERWIDELTNGLPELKNFILPTGHPVAAALHQCRTVSRRAERMIINAREGETGAEPGSERGAVDIDPVVIRYVNRLADLFFVLAREANKIYGIEDEPWSAPKSS